MDSDEFNRLPPTQQLVLEILGARTRLGETGWPITSKLRVALGVLEDLGLVRFKNGIVEHTFNVWLTEAGKAAVLMEDYSSPLEDRVKELEFEVATLREVIPDRVLAALPRGVSTPARHPRDCVMCGLGGH